LVALVRSVEVGDFVGKYKSVPETKSMNQFGSRLLKTSTR